MSGAIAHDPADGLRARKRAATTATIERVALDLAMQQGYDNVTVDMICAGAQVSPRTFFNYFGSKEGAVLGPAAPEPSDEERSAFIRSSSSDVIGDLTRMLTRVMIDNGHQREVFAARRAVVTATPALLRKQVDRVSDQEAKLTQLVLERFAHQGRTTQQTPDLEDEARMVVTFMGTLLRFSARHWFDGPESVDVLSLLEKSLALARRVAGNGD